LFFTSKNSIILKVGGKITNIKINKTNFLQNLQRKENMAEEAVVPATMDSIAADVRKLEESAKRYYKKLADKITEKENEMAEVLTPSMIMGGGGGDGLFGAGGGGLIGGLILGSLLRNNGNLFGNGAEGAALRSPPEQSQANMSIMQALGDINRSVALGTATTETSNATQTGQLTNAVNAATSANLIAIQGVKDNVSSGTMVLAQQLNGLQQQVMENRYELSKDISSDGEKTRALITQQYEATLNRQLSDANAAVIALQAKLDTSSATRGVEVTTTNNINQMQQQQQQQQQWGQLYNVLWGLAQNIRSNNEAINVGSGTLTANPTNTNTNIR
jgi:hypothetical protein